MKLSARAALPRCARSQGCGNLAAAVSGQCRMSQRGRGTLGAIALQWWCCKQSAGLSCAAVCPAQRAEGTTKGEDAFYLPHLFVLGCCMGLCFVSLPRCPPADAVLLSGPGLGAGARMLSLPGTISLQPPANSPQLPAAFSALLPALPYK